MAGEPHLLHARQQPGVDCGPLFDPASQQLHEFVVGMQRDVSECDNGIPEAALDSAEQDVVKKEAR
jgi:hypothetical protein